MIGSASLDTLTIEGTEYSSPGGAGLYTALAAVRCNADVTLYAPYPNPMPAELEFIPDRIDWVGPVVNPAELPRFDIIQKKESTIYNSSHFGAEENLSTSGLPEDLSNYDIVHVVPLGNPGKQLEFIDTCRSRGARKISAGTGKQLVEKHLQKTRQVFQTADYFFMNEEESLACFGQEPPRAQPGKVLFITKGTKGASVWISKQKTTIDAVNSEGLDPTGAGDTFCGATLAGIGAGEHPVIAGMSASCLAAEMITGIGPETLYSKADPPVVQTDERVKENSGQVRKVADLISGLTEEKPYNFIASSLPPLNHPLTVDYFFVTTLQQFSFWTIRNGHYHQPLIDTIGNEELKGAFYLFKAYTQLLDSDPDFFSPERQSELRMDDMLELFRSDEGRDVMPALESHLDAANRYGRAMVNLDWTPQNMLETASASPTPLKTFLTMLDNVGGYREDPLRKKSSLLAMILNNRPEKFLIFGENEFLPPIVDYHCMRSILRMGLIDVTDDDLVKKLIHRRIVIKQEEWAVRYAAYRVVEKLPILSGRSMATVDGYFFFSRKRCPEMTEPDCASCNADPVCAHRKELFQPVIRTDYY